MLAKENNKITSTTRSLEKQMEILEYIKNFTAKNGYSPTVREIGQAVGLSSTSSVQTYLNAMEDNEFIKKGNRPRTIKILDERYRRTNIPVVKELRADDSLLDPENISGYVSTPWAYPDETVVFLKVEDPELTCADINLCDMIMIRKTDQVPAGNMAVIRNKEGYQTLLITPDNETCKGIFGEIVGYIKRAECAKPSLADGI